MWDREARHGSRENKEQRPAAALRRFRARACAHARLNIMRMHDEQHLTVSEMAVIYIRMIIDSGDIVKDIPEVP